MKLKEIASDQLVTANPSDSVDSTFKLMVEHDIRHLPIVDGNTVVGIVSDRDLLVIVCWISAWNSLTERPIAVGRKRVAELSVCPATGVCANLSMD